MKMGADKLYANLLEELNTGCSIYSEAQAKFLSSVPDSHGQPCQEQFPHYDYTLPDIEDHPPMSSLCALHGDCTHLIIYREYQKSQILMGDKEKSHYWHKIYIPLYPGDMLIWTSSIIHSGGMYRRLNVRLFAYHPTNDHKPTNSIDQVDLDHIYFTTPGQVCRQSASK